MKSFMLKRTWGRRTNRFELKHFHTSNALFWHNWILALSVLLLSGTLCRVARLRLNLIAENPVLLPVALSSFPSVINDWASRDVQIPKYIQKIAGNDDFLYRFFVHKPSNQWVNLYVAYSGRPGIMLGHRPEVCYTADGWIHENSEQLQFQDAHGRQIPCSIHRFHKPGSGYEEMVVLNFYVLNGRIADGERDFSGLGWRTPNLEGNPARYVAQVQISSVLENSVRMAAKDMTVQILNFLPDENGKVKVAGHVEITGDILPALAESLGARQ